MKKRDIALNRDGRVTLMPHPSQQAFLAALKERTPDGARAYTRFVLLSGRRGGKTQIGAVAAALEASIPNTTGWACAPSYPELHDYVLPALRKTIPASWIKDWSEQRQEFLLQNGSQIQLRSLDDPDRGRGPGLNWLWIDEARKVQELAWQTLLPALVDKRGIAWVTTSPNGYDWVYKRFWVPAQQGRPGYWGVRYTTLDNPAISAEEVEEARQSMDEAFFRQEFLADFVHFTGAVWGALVDPQVVPAGQESLVIPEWPSIAPSRLGICGIDPGADHPFAGVGLVVTENGLVAIGEHLARNKPIIEHAAALRALMSGRETQWAVDRTAPQIRVELAQHGITAVPSESEVTAGIRRVESWLVTRKLWLLESRVPQLIAQMRSYRWAENTDRRGQARNELVWKVDDDLCDALRYAVMLWPELPAPVTPLFGRVPSSVPEESRWAWEREQRCNRDESDAAGLSPVAWSPEGGDEGGGLHGFFD